MSRERFVFKEVVSEADAGAVIEFLAARTGLSRTRIKDVMNKGAVWLGHGKKRQRLRRATAVARPGDRLELFYDERILALEPTPAVCVADLKHYSVWHKPAGLLTQGSEYGDHCSLLRQVEKELRRPVHPVHRLDREVEGLVVIAHSPKAAGELSRLFQRDQVMKQYRATVRGNLMEEGVSGSITTPLDDKPAHSDYLVEGYDRESDTSTVSVFLHTGRLHQIRRHLDSIGHPVMGDPRYGRRNKNTTGLMLRNVTLAFTCPFSGQDLLFTLE